MKSVHIKHLVNLQALREHLNGIGKLKESYNPVFQALENTLKKLAATEAIRPTVTRMRASISQGVDHV